MVKSVRYAKRKHQNDQPLDRKDRSRSSAAQEKREESEGETDRRTGLIIVLGQESVVEISVADDVSVVVEYLDPGRLEVTLFEVETGPANVGPGRSGFFLAVIAVLGVIGLDKWIACFGHLSGCQSQK